MNKAEIMTKKHGKKCPLAPRLRFPEFRDAGEWHSQPLGELAFIIKEKAGDRKCVLMSIKAGVGLIPQIDKFGKEIAGQQYKNYIILHKNDFAYNKSSTKEYPEGFIAMYAGSEIAAVPNSIFTCFRIKVDNISHQYLNYLFSCNFHGKYLRRYVTVGARAHGALAIDDADLLSLPIPYPMANSSFHEQQRIADCLSSLDARIAAETDKLDALKAHKKGLLKQLFPAEGETTPKLRFPEFRDLGEWVRKKVCQIADIYKGKGISKANLSIAGEQPCIHYGELYTLYSEVITNVTSKTSLSAENLFLSKVNDVIIPSSGETKIDISRSSCVMKDNVALGGDLNVIRSCQNGIFISYYFNGNLKEVIAKIAQGDTVVHLYPTQIGQLIILIPSKKEQQRIADSLSSLDELIAAQAQKISLLKEHKKGLMQQLFPVPNEA